MMADEMTTDANGPFEFRITGLDGLRRYIDRHPQVISLALQQVMNTLLPRVQNDTPQGIRYRKKPKGAPRVRGVVQGRWTATTQAEGAMKYSWHGELHGDYASVWTDTPYAQILERGGYHGIGKPRWGLGTGGPMQISPRTVATGGGIFSSRAVGGIVGPILADNELIGKFTSLVVREIQRSFPR